MKRLWIPVSLSFSSLPAVAASATWLALSLLALTLLAPLPARASGTSVVQTLPPKPALLPPIHGMELGDDGYEYVAPFLPLMSTTRDYRLGVSRKTYVHQGVRDVRFFLLKPEAFEEAGAVDFSTGIDPQTGAFVDWIDTFDMYADNSGNLRAVADDFHTHPETSPPPGEDPAFGLMHFAICDSTEGYDDHAQPHGRSPYECAPGLDCYEFDLVLGLSLDGSSAYPTQSGYPEAQLFSTRVRVKIANPKTADAEIQSVEIVDKDADGDRADETLTGPRFAGTTVHGIGSFHTPMIVGDANQLLFARIGGLSVPEYTDENDLPRTSGRHDMVYSVNTSASQCDVDGWTELRPISFAPVDDDVAGFGFAQDLFRTPSGRVIEPHEEIQGNYLWVDQEANNLFFSTTRRLLLSSELDPSLPLYDFTCWDGETPCVSDERTGTHQGWMMAGLWTNHKMVLLDSLVNNMDFGIRAAEKHHLSVRLYSDQSVRIGTGQEATLVEGGAEPEGWARTTVQLGSAEHFLNLVDEMLPRTPRDVVWHVTAGAHTDEIAFDDYISHRTLIFSPMNALKEMDPGVDATYYDGHQPQTVNGERPMRLQNASTSKDFLVPAYGEVDAATGEGRIENVALGGIKGRGFYLYPQSTITYDIPSQTFAPQDWLVSLFLDRRDPGRDNPSRLLTFPSGASISLKGADLVTFCNSAGTACTDVLLPIPVPGSAWTHLAFELLSSGTVRLYQDGFRFAELVPPQALTVAGGALRVGKGPSSAGFIGWIDELKLVAGPFTVEEICNHARGTLVSMPHDFSTRKPTSPFTRLAAPFHDWETVDTVHGVSGRQAVHDALYAPGAHAWPASDEYACHVDYTTHLGVSAQNPGDPEIRSLRRRLLFAEGPLIHDQPRPSSITNEFCLSCHATTRPAGLHTDALIADPLGRTAENDPRRMPLQAPRDLVGVVPQDYLGIGRPATATTFDDAAPLVTDRWIHNGPLFRWGFDEAGGGIAYNQVSGDVDGGHMGDVPSTVGAATRPGVGRGHSLEFDGSGGHLRVDDDGNGREPDVDGDELTLAAWVQLDTNTLGTFAEEQCLPFTDSVPCTVIAKSGHAVHDVTWGLRLVYNSGWTVQMHVTNASGTIANRTMNLPGTFQTTAWTHLAAVYDSGTVEFFVDGTSLGAPVAIHTGVTDLATDPTEPVTLGAKLKENGSVAIFPFHGRLDEVHVFDRALDDWEIATLVIETP